MTMKFYVNTDTVDIQNKQIGIHYQNTVNREFCAGVNHIRTKDSVAKASEIANLFAAAPEMLEALRMSLVCLEYREVENHFAIEAVKAAIAKAKGE